MKNITTKITKISLVALMTATMFTSANAEQQQKIDWTKRASDNCFIAYRLQYVLDKHNKDKLFCSNSENDSLTRVSYAKATNEALTQRFGKISNSSLKNLGIGINTEKDLAVFSVNYQKFVCELKKNAKDTFIYFTFINGRMQDSYKKYDKFTNKNWGIEDSVDTIINNKLTHIEIFSPAYFIEKIMLTDYFSKEDSIKTDKELKQFVKAIFMNDINKALKIATKTRTSAVSYYEYCKNIEEKMKNRGK